MAHQINRTSRLGPWVLNCERWYNQCITAESARRLDAVSPVGAAGLMQIMPGPADDLDVLDRKRSSDRIFGGIPASCSLIIPMIWASVKRLFRIRLLIQKVEQTLHQSEEGFGGQVSASDC